MSCWPGSSLPEFRPFPLAFLKEYCSLTLLILLIKIDLDGGDLRAIDCTFLLSSL